MAVLRAVGRWGAGAWLFAGCTALLDPEALVFPDARGAEGVADGPAQEAAPGVETGVDAPAAGDPEATPDSTPAVASIRLPGVAGACSVSFYDADLDTTCPKTCPEAAGWLLTYKLTGPEAAYHWDFEVLPAETGGASHRVEPSGVSGDTAAVRVTLNAAVFGGSCVPSATPDVKEFEVKVKLSADGKVVDTQLTKVKPTSVAAGACDPAEECAAP